MIEDVHTGRADTVQGGGLLKEFTLRTGVAVIVGQIIGSGIFVTPNSVLRYGGSFGACMLLWLAGSLVSMAGGLCYIELGLLVKRGGGESGYLTEAYSLKKRSRWSELFGSMLGFLFVWSNVCILRPASLGIQSLTCARYLTRPFYGDSQVPEYLVKAVALAVLVMITAVNSISVKTTAKVVTVLSATKILAVVFVAVVGVIFTLHKGTYPEAFQHPFVTTEGHVTSPATVALAMYGVLWSYDGWNAMNYAIEETKDVKRTLPLSLLIGIPIVAISYMLVNLAFFATLSYEQILQSDAVALPFGEATLGKAGLVIIPLLVAVSNFGSLVGTLFTGSRITFSAARDGLLPEFLSGIQKNFKTPLPATLMLFFMGSALLMVGDISDLIEGCSASVFLFYLLVIIGLIIMRFTHKEEPRLFKSWFILPVAVFMVVVFTFLVFLPLLLQPIPSLVAFSIILLGAPVYIFLIMEKPWRLRPKLLDTISGKVSQVVHSLLNTETSRN